jgi:eukaryotic-like serine/threonine-protein kinase
MANATTIAGRYQIEGRLGVGGMSTVHLAFDQRLERHVALKLLAEHLADDPAFVSRFRREALAAARLVHPNIVQVFDFGFDERQHQHFIVMEHVAGHSCAELLRDRGHLDVDQAVDIIAQSCRGLEYAHRHGVVHRDVKPGNLLLSDADLVKLADFGIARATDQSSITQVGSVLGTAAYLSPEQARGEEAGPQADIYSLGVVAYQLMSGRLPYEASSLSELALMQQRESPVPLDQVNNRVPTELAHAVAVALSIDKQARPTDALSFGETLRNGANGIEPPPVPVAAHSSTSETQLLGGREPATSATRVAAPRPSRQQATGATPARPARRLEPQPHATGGYETRAPHERAAQRRGRERRAGRRFAGFLALLCLVAAVAIVAVVIATSTSNTAVQARKTIAHDVNSAINQVQSLIGQYTK